MKTKIMELPTDVATLGDALATITDDLDKLAADRTRAESAVVEAERLNGELEAITRARAETKANAFVAGTQADLAELDSQLQALQTASRAAREDGTAAELAIALLDAKRVELEASKAATITKRHQIVMSWLSELGAAGMKHYIDAIEALESHVVQAAAADRVRLILSRVAGDPIDEAHCEGLHLLKKTRGCDYGIPQKFWYCFNGQPWRPPVPWLTSHHDTGKAQDAALVDEIIQLLRAAHVIP
ncbi:hypothetical protein [Dyella silvae]|uniref:hypothetical protein n=1 Tax=Dyella silvae TaxID=2994424 RepID=UPI00226423CF|nr:hypothetical protein [Dyella silvae]